jgi:DsbC/DsbD-like thiol-disulfide interchange protein
MKRRHILAGLVALPWQAALLAQAQDYQPYRVSLVPAGRDGKDFRAGLRIALDPGWKTYWRMPGQSGVPPEFDWSPSADLSAVKVAYPLPRRFENASGDTVGYEREVVFPLAIDSDDGLPPRLGLSFFFAACRDVCIPATSSLDLDLANNIEPIYDLAPWLARVPVPGTIAQSALAEGDDRLRLVLAAQVEDVFVETGGTAYFHRPRLEKGGLEAVMDVTGLKPGTSLRGLGVRLTAATPMRPLEQRLVIA